MENLNVNEWSEQVLKDENAIILDVRTSDEYAEGAIPNAINIDVKQPQLFLDKVNELDKTQNFYVYCQSGARSSEACAVLNLMCAITSIYNLNGGFSVWNGDVVTLSNY
ncbi:MAG: rhodanese-like domain-containing protein [Flavobacteriaceae bacterium]